MTEQFAPPTYIGMNVWYFKQGRSSREHLVATVTKVMPNGLCNLTVFDQYGGTYGKENVRHYADPWFKGLESRHYEFGYWTGIPTDVILNSNPDLLNELTRAIRNPAFEPTEDVAGRIRSYIAAGHTDAQINSFLKKAYPNLDLKIVSQIRAQVEAVPPKMLKQASQGVPPTEPTKTPAG